MVRLRSKSCPRCLRLSGAGGDEVTRAISGSEGSSAGDGRCRRSPAATLTAGECGVKDQVSRPQLTATPQQWTIGNGQGGTGTSPSSARAAQPRRRTGGRRNRAWQEDRVRRDQGPDRGEGGPARPSVPRPRPGRGSLLRGAQPEDLRPRVL